MRGYLAASLDEDGRYGIRRDETSGPGEPQTENLDGLFFFFGLGRVTAAERRVLEADPGIMDLLEGGEVADECFFSSVGLHSAVSQTLLFGTRRREVSVARETGCFGRMIVYHLGFWSFS